jgi:hypothetical protein
VQETITVCSCLCTVLVMTQRWAGQHTWCVHEACIDHTCCTCAPGLDPCRPPA